MDFRDWAMFAVSGAGLGLFAVVAADHRRDAGQSATAPEKACAKPDRQHGQYSIGRRPLDGTGPGFRYGFNVGLFEFHRALDYGLSLRRGIETPH